MTFVGGCVSRDNTALPTSSRGITAERGSEQARRDISAGRVQLLEAGTRGVYAPGLPVDDERFSKLPRHRLPCGCTTPNASLWVRYAEAYNLVVIAHVKNHPAL